MTDKDILFSIGSDIRTTREVLGVTQKQLADKVGITQSSISRIEHGYQEVSLKLLLKIYRSLGYELTVKVTGDEQE